MLKLSDIFWQYYRKARNIALAKTRTDQLDDDVFSVSFDFLQL